MSNVSPQTEPTDKNTQSKADNTEAENQLSATDVVQWLQEKREFFYENPQLLDIMRLPHRAGSKASSLIERQVERLRENMSKQDQQMQSFLEIATENEQLSQNMHDLAVAVLSADSLQTATTILVSGLHEDFNADDVAVVLRTKIDEGASSDATDTTDVSRLPMDNVFWQQHAEWLDSGKVAVGRPTELSNDIFAERTVESLVCVPLCNAHTPIACGVLAIGSPNAERFPPGTNTELLQRLAELIAAKFAYYLDQ